MIQLCIFLPMFILTACTMSFSNVSTAGRASDVIDEEQTANPTVSPTLDLPSLPI